MKNLNIDRLTLKLSGISESDGQHLARRNAQGLASGVITNVAARDSPNIHITIPANSNTDVDWLANQIVAEVLRQINQTLA